MWAVFEGVYVVHHLFHVPAGLTPPGRFVRDQVRQGCHRPFDPRGEHRFTPNERPDQEVGIWNGLSDTRQGSDGERRSVQQGDQARAHLNLGG